jgi:SAM-dependent methyltransferase
VSTPSGVADPYDWDDYQSDWKPSAAYEAQEAALLSILTVLDPPPKTVLEVGPGFGRVTKILTQLWPATDTHLDTGTHGASDVEFYLTDLSKAAIEQASTACSTTFFRYEVGRLEDHRLFSGKTFDLVVAIEVLLHIPPGSRHGDSQHGDSRHGDSANVQRAVNNLLAYVKPKTGALITCDWTQALPPRRDGTPHPIRRDNFLHDYPALLAHARPEATLVAAVPTGLQTIFVIRRSLPTRPTK